MTLILVPECMHCWGWENSFKAKTQTSTSYKPENQFLKATPQTQCPCQCNHCSRECSWSFGCAGNKEDWEPLNGVQKSIQLYMGIKKWNMTRYAVRQKKIYGEEDYLLLFKIYINKGLKNMKKIILKSSILTNSQNECSCYYL